MKIYRYWASAEENAHDMTGRPLLLKKWCGSNESPEVALELAQTAVSTLCAQVANRKLPLYQFRRNTKDYPAYETGGRPEEFIEELDAHTIITRNRAGVLVLNTEHLLFADIDLPKHGFAKLIALFKGNPEVNAIEKLKSWLASQPDVGARVYRTAGGLRYLFTHAPLRVDTQTLGWLQTLGSDPLYTKLCKAQQCYRARLTPKAWRIKVQTPPNGYPRTTHALQVTFNKWLSSYNTASQKFAVCQFIGAFGAKEHHGDLADIIVQHDRITRATSQLPLA
jgi:hypothetical protein